LGRHVGGGATLVGSLMNQRLIDELRLVVYPIVLGGRKALFKDVKERHALKFLGTKPLESGFVCLHSAVSSGLSGGKKWPAICEAPPGLEPGLS
jgi:dihydrofolate reductase